MTLLIEGGILMDPYSGREEKTDILIENGKIKHIGKNISCLKEMDRLDASGCIVAPGFIDVHVHFREPGFSHKEEIKTGALAAAAGGYTTVVCMANTKPVADKEEIINYVMEEGEKTGITVLTVGCITKNMEGKELTDMEALKKGGAIGFSDDGKPMMDNLLVEEAMKEGVRLNMPLSFHEEDPNYVWESGVNAGKAAKSLGLKGASSRAEWEMIKRDIALAKKTVASINIQHISSKKSIELVREGKASGGNIHAEVTPHHFSLTEDAVTIYGTMAKMNPPLRQEEDRQAILDGLKDGTIDIIATDHAPHKKEEKEVPFPKAPSGIIGLETALSLGITNLVKKGVLSMMELLEKMTINPAKLYRMDKGYIAEGKTADLVIFHPDKLWKVEKFASKSWNSPFLGENLYGKVEYTIAKGNIVFKNEN